MQVPGVDFKDSFYPVALENSTRILIGLNLYYEDDGWIAELCNVEAAYLEAVTRREGVEELAMILPP